MIFEQNAQYYENPPKSPTTISSLFSRKPWKQWAVRSVYDKYRPVRPWGLGQIYQSDTGIWLAAGRITRTPGLYMRSDPETGTATDEPLTNTNERIHSSVRIRLDLEGLGLDDVGLYNCPALLQKGPWKLRQMRIKVRDPIPANAYWPGAPATPPERDDDVRWAWEYAGPEMSAPKVHTLIEESLGPHERQLLLLNKGNEIFSKS